MVWSSFLEPLQKTFTLQYWKMKPTKKRGEGFQAIELKMLRERKQRESKVRYEKKTDELMRTSYCEQSLMTANRETAVCVFSCSYLPKKGI